MKKTHLFILAPLFLFSCKSKTIVPPTGQEIVVIENNIPVIDASKKTDANYLKAVNAHYAINKEFKTLQINADVVFKNSDYNQSFPAEIKIKKGETILITVKYLGISGAKLLITPDRVSYYEILNNSYYDGDFKFLNTFLGTDLDFAKVENLLIGNALFDLKEEELVIAVTPESYKLYKDAPTLSIVFLLDSLAMLKQEVIEQKGSKDKLVVDYLSYQTVNNLILPNQMLIRAIQKEETNININYKKIRVNQELTFPYKVPNNSKAIIF